MDRSDLALSARSFYDAEMERQEEAKRAAIKHGMERLTTSGVTLVYGVAGDTIRQAHRHGRIEPAQVLTDTGGKRHNLWRSEDVVRLWDHQADPDALATARENGLVMNGWLVLSGRPVVSIEYRQDKRGGHFFRTKVELGTVPIAESLPTPHSLRVEQG